jgi:hypothetical protein
MELPLDVKNLFSDTHVSTRIQYGDDYFFIICRVLISTAFPGSFLW